MWQYVCVNKRMCMCVRVCKCVSVYARTMTKPVFLTIWTLIRRRNLVDSQSSELSFNLVVRDGGFGGGSSTGDTFSCSWSFHHLESHMGRKPHLQPHQLQNTHVQSQSCYLFRDRLRCTAACWHSKTKKKKNCSNWVTILSINCKVYFT